MRVIIVSSKENVLKKYPRKGITSNSQYGLQRVDMKRMKQLSFTSRSRIKEEKRPDYFPQKDKQLWNWPIAQLKALLNGTRIILKSQTTSSSLTQVMYMNLNSVSPRKSNQKTKVENCAPKSRLTTQGDGMGDMELAHVFPTIPRCIEDRPDRPAGIEPATWRITAQFLYGYTFVLSFYTNS